MARRKRVSLDADFRALVHERDDYCCQYCGAPAEELCCDHIIPISRGGPDDIDNLITACRRCNSMKSGRTPLEWLRVVGVKRRRRAKPNPYVGMGRGLALALVNRGEAELS